MKFLIATLLLIFANFAQAERPRSEERVGEKIPLIEWTDLRGRTQSIEALKDLPVILVPFYTNCHASCPVTVQKLTEALSRSDLDSRKYQVLLFSIDPSETRDNLRRFQEKNHLPLRWMIGFSSASEIQKLLNSLNYEALQAGTDFDHPDLVVFLTPDLRISSFLPGNRIQASELAARIENARANRTWMTKAGPWILGLSVIGLLFSTLITVHALTSLKSKPENVVAFRARSPEGKPG